MAVAEAEKPSHHWTSAPEPHALRRKLILQKHGERIRPLMGNNNWTFLPVAVATVLQTASAAAVGIYDVPWWAVFVLAYVFSAIGAGNLMAAHHEISHFLVFKRPFWSRVLMIGANAPLAVPLGSLFKQYHQDHHAHMGVDGNDTGIWTALEGRWVRGNFFTKFIFMLWFPIPFFFRPFFMRIQKQPDWTDAVSWIFVPAYDAAMWYYCGQSLKPLAYLLLGTYIGVGLHPIAGHVISEHVNLSNSGQETHSCYDPLLNNLLYNFGYHVEHHDFPNIPWNRLPELRKIAPEFYNHLVSYPNWTYVFYKFLTDSAVGGTGVMIKRIERTGGRSSAAPMFTPASAMPLLRGVTTGAIH